MLPTELETLPSRHRLRVARVGNANAPPLILLHGYPDNLQIWCELAPRLADLRRVIAFDWPGMGQSEAWPGGIGVGKWREGAGFEAAVGGQVEKTPAGGQAATIGLLVPGEDDDGVGQGPKARLGEEARLLLRP